MTAGPQSGTPSRRRGQGMSRTSEASSPLFRPDARFFQRLAAATSRLLMLDYDGTLAPFRVRPGKAAPYRGVRRALSTLTLAGHTRVVIVSGRTIKDLVEVLGMEPLPELWGSHGWEQRTPDGRYHLWPLAERSRDGLRLARDCMKEAGLADRCEEKPAGVALHWRGLTGRVARSLEERGRACWEPLVRAHGLELRAFDGGIELRASGRDKGAVVRTLVAEAPPGAVAAYLGDDLTDEDAFKALPPEGLGVLVRRVFRPTAADAWLRPPQELSAFLDQWARAGASRRWDAPGP